MPRAHVQRARDRGDRPPAVRQQMIDGLTRPAAVVGVDVRQRGAAERPADENGGNPGPVEPARKRVVSVQRHQHDAVDVLGTQVARRALALLVALHDHQHEVLVDLGRRAADPARERREERVGEEPCLRLAHDEGDRVGAARHEGARSLIRDVPELRDRALDRRADLIAHLRRVVDDARDRRPGDACEVADFHQGRARPGPSPFQFRHQVPPSPSPPAEITRAYQRALSFGVRRRVS